MATIHSLPAECIFRIFELLDPRKPALHSAALAHSSWTHLAQSVLLRRVDLHSARQTRAYLSVSGEMRQRGMVTRELELDLDRDGVERADLGRLLVQADTLRTLTIQTGLQTVPVRLLCLPSLSGLKRLDIDARLEMDDHGEIELPFNLEYLAMTGQHYPVPLLFKLVECCHPALTSLSLRGLQSPLADHHSFFALLTPLARQLTSLTLLGFWADTAHPAYDFLRECTSLGHLETYTITEGIADSLSRSVSSLALLDSSLGVEVHIRLVQILEHVRRIRFAELTMGDLSAHWGTWLACSARGVKLEFGRG